MALPLNLGPSALRGGLLRGLIGPGAPHADVPDRLLRDALHDAVGHLGPRPAPDPGTNSEVEAAYPWPSALPGDGILRIRTRIRPVVEILG